MLDLFCTARVPRQCEISIVVVEGIRDVNVHLAI
jgi:hypothetical protein